MRRSGVSMRWRELCGDRFYVEVHRTSRGRRGGLGRDAAMDMASERGVPAVATNDVRFLTRADFEAHEARVCIHDGALLADSSRPRRYSEEQYLKSPAEMAELFEDVPELLDNRRGNRQALLARDPPRQLHAAGLCRARWAGRGGLPARGSGRTGSGRGGVRGVEAREGGRSNEPGSTSSSA